jgi:hypothetical protein
MRMNQYLYLKEDGPIGIYKYKVPCISSAVLLTSVSHFLFFVYNNISFVLYSCLLLSVTLCNNFLYSPLFSVFSYMPVSHSVNSSVCLFYL